MVERIEDGKLRVKIDLTLCEYNQTIKSLVTHLAQGGSDDRTSATTDERYFLGSIIKEMLPNEEILNK